MSCGFQAFVHEVLYEFLNILLLSTPTTFCSPHLSGTSETTGDPPLRQAPSVYPG